MGENVEGNFTAFYQGWIIKQQEIHQHMLAFISNNFINPNSSQPPSHSRDDTGTGTGTGTGTSSSRSTESDEEEECRKVIEKVIEHYQEYHRERNRVANEDVFMVLSPPWITFLERSLIWISCFKPSMLFPLIDNTLLLAGGGFQFQDEDELLTGDQKKVLRRIKAHTKREERQVDKVMAQVQESVSSMTIDGMLREHGRLVNGEESRLVTAIEDLKGAMLVILEKADAIRASTIIKLLDILKPRQTIRFLAAATRFLIHTRTLGLQQRELAASSTATAANADAADAQPPPTAPPDDLDDDAAAPPTA